MLYKWIFAFCFYAFYLYRNQKSQRLFVLQSYNLAVINRWFIYVALKHSIVPQ